MGQRAEKHKHKQASKVEAGSGRSAGKHPVGKAGSRPKQARDNQEDSSSEDDAGAATTTLPLVPMSDDEGVLGMALLSNNSNLASFQAVTIG